MSDNFFHQVYELVRQVPRGKVTTYGHLARALNTRDARRVGHALHANPDPGTPCHRVVNKEGKLAPGYAFGGANTQKQKLQSEGVTFTDDLVNLEKHLWTPSLS